MVTVLGVPDTATLLEMGVSEATIEIITPIIQSLPHKPLRKLLSGKASPEAIDLLEKLLEFHPSKRISAKEAMHHPFFKRLIAPNDTIEPELADTQIDLSFMEEWTSIDDCKKATLDLIVQFHHHARKYGSQEE